MKNIIIGISLIILSLILASWMDSWFVVGDCINCGLKGWIYEHGDFVIIPLPLIGFAFLFWNQINEPFFTN